MISQSERTQMTEDAQRMVERWKSLGYDFSDMPHELLLQAMIVAFQQSYNRQMMLGKLDMLITHIGQVKEKVATDWVYMQEFKKRTVRRIHNDDQHPRLFPDRY